MLPKRSHYTYTNRSRQCYAALRFAANVRTATRHTSSSYQAIEFMAKVDKKAKTKIYYNLDKAKLGLDPELFKKLTDDIWELRTKYAGLQYRLFAFWDRTGKTETLVISTHGMVKKTDKIPKIEKAKQIRAEYFEQ